VQLPPKRSAVPFITSIATAVPPFSATQDEVKAAFGPLFPLDGRRLDAAMSLFDHAEVGSRYSVLPLADVVHPRTLTETLRIYARSARELGARVGRDCLRSGGVDATEVDLIISVSCTGVMIPSLDAYLMDALGMRRDLRRLPITELGCVGGAAALARAYDHLVGHPTDRVLVVSVELPSLSLQRLDVSPGNLVSAAIFGDGAAAVLLTGDAVARAPVAGGGADADGSGLGAAAGAIQIRGALCDTIPESAHALGFDLSEDGFHSVLAKEVPALVKVAFRDLVERLARRAGLDMEQLGAFVLHPGGKKVLGAVEEALGLRREDTQPSWDTLRRYGNQSSASVLFVLQRWMTDHRPPPGTCGVLAAFGPGLTTELLLLEWP
jgi:alkylresorcinol/alkylpyrone synthase